MADNVRKSFYVKDFDLELRVELFGEFVQRERLKINKELFEKMCKDGCDKYGKHYGCPPGSPSFADYTEGAETFLALMFCVSSNGATSQNFEEIEKAVYPKIDGVLRKLEKISGTKHIAARSCKLCEPCKRQLNNPCSQIEAMRNCTVSLGIDCQDIAENIFHKALVWQKGGDVSGYVSFICLVPLKEIKISEKIVGELEKSIN